MKEKTNSMIDAVSECIIDKRKSFNYSETRDNIIRGIIQKYLWQMNSLEAREQMMTEIFITTGIRLTASYNQVKDITTLETI